MALGPIGIFLHELKRESDAVAIAVFLFNKMRFAI
jgi:hypothetical protein